MYSIYVNIASVQATIKKYQTIKWVTEKKKKAFIFHSPGGHVVQDEGVNRFNT